MESRMEKYYRENPEYYKRSKRNAGLYKDIDNNINDLENLPIPDNSNEIDINGLKQIISSRDEYRKAKDMGRTITRKRVEEEPREEKRRVYDINVLLETAKNEVNKNNEVEGKKLINANQWLFQASFLKSPFGGFRGLPKEEPEESWEVLSG